MPIIYNKIEIIYYKQSVCIITIMSVNQICYFCDETYPHPSCFITNYDDLWICDSCDNFTLPINYSNCRENGDCCVCLEENPLVKLPTCSHKVCLKCCKTIYFGFTTVVRPLHWREIDNECPNWPFYECEDYNEDDEDKKQEEYYYFEHTYFNYEENTYDELTEIRNSLIYERPDWMNTEEFINYENNCFRYNTEFPKVDKDWNEWNDNKTKGNGTCPLCRAKPI